MDLHEFIIFKILLACAIATALGQVHQIKLSQGLKPTTTVADRSTDDANVANSQIMYSTSKTSLSMLGYGEKKSSNTYKSYVSEEEGGSKKDVFLPHPAILADKSTRSAISITGAASIYNFAVVIQITKYD